MASWAPWVSRRRASDLGRRGGSRRRQGMRSRAGGSSGGRGRRRIARRQGCIRSRSCQTSIERMWRRRKGGGRPLADIDTRDGRIGPHAPVPPRDIVRATACLNGVVTTGRTRPGRTDSDLGVGPPGRLDGPARRAGRGLCRWTGPRVGRGRPVMRPRMAGAASATAWRRRVSPAAPAPARRAARGRAGSCPTPTRCNTACARPRRRRPGWWWTSLRGCATRPGVRHGG